MYENHLEKEEQLIILFARQILSEDNVFKIKELFLNDIDYDKLEKIGYQHKINTFIGYHLSNNIFADVIKEDFGKKMISEYQKEKEKNQLYFKLLDDLQILFRKNNIKFVLIKGPLITKQVYTHTNVRPFNDIDIIINSQDIKKVHILLKENNFRAHKRGIRKSDEEVYKSAFDLHQLYPYNKDSFNLDVHHFGPYYLSYIDNTYYSLERFYKNSKELKINNELVCVPDLINQFLFSLFHLLHHVWQYDDYSIYMLQISEYKQSKLLHFMDVRETYLTIINNNLLENLISLVKSLKIEEIFTEALAKVEKVFGSFVNLDKYNLKTNNKILDWQQKNWISLYVQRILRGEKEYDRLIDSYKDYFECKLPGPKVKTIKKDKYPNEEQLKENMYIEYISPNDINDKQYWGVLSTGEAIKNEDDFNASFQIAWDHDNFYFYLDVNDDSIVLKGEDATPWNIDRCLLLFGEKEGDYPVGFRIFPKFSNKLKVEISYFTELTKDNEWSDISDKINGNCIIKNNHYNININVPWKLIKIKPELNKKILFEVKIWDIDLDINKMYEHLYSWACGKYNIPYWSPIDIFSTGQLELV